MNWKFFNKPLGDDMSPFGSSNKRGDSATGSWVPFFSTLDTLISGQNAHDRMVEQVKSQERINKENLEYAREVNKQQQENWIQEFKNANRQYEQNRKWVLQDLVDERAYNHPSAIASRLRQAGINPAMYFGSGATSNPVSQMSSTQGSPSGSFSGVPYHAEAADISGFFQSPETSIMNNIGRSINAFAQSELMRSQSKNLDADTQRDMYQLDFDKRADKARIEYLQKLADGQGYVADMAKTQLAFEQAVQGQRISQVFNDVRLQERSLKQMDEQYTNYQLQNDLMKIQIAYEPRMSEAKLKHFYADINQLKASAALTLANATLTYEQKANLIQDRIAKVLQNGITAKEFNAYDVSKQLANKLLDEQGKSQYIQNMMSPYEYFDKYRGRGMQFLPNFSGAAASRRLEERLYKR